jgi:hypothetical protein
VAYWFVNLEAGLPSVEEALGTFRETLRRAAEAGLQGLVVVHGYGASGSGGKIRRALREGLEQNAWADRIADAIAGEDLKPGGEAYQALIARRPKLKSVLRRNMLGNSGITVVLLSRQARDSRR